MSRFRDFNDEGPGTFKWDFVLGGNTTGLFPEEKHYEVNGDMLVEVFFRHIGGGKYEAYYGDSWEIGNVSPIQKDIDKDWFTFEQDKTPYVATIVKEFNKGKQLIVDIKEM